MIHSFPAHICSGTLAWWAWLYCPTEMLKLPKKNFIHDNIRGIFEKFLHFYIFAGIGEGGRSCNWSYLRVSCDQSVGQASWPCSLVRELSCCGEVGCETYKLHQRGAAISHSHFVGRRCAGSTNSSPHVCSVWGLKFSVIESCMCGLKCSKMVALLWRMRSTPDVQLSRAYSRNVSGVWNNCHKWNVLWLAS
jgi:hypothetical protein